MKKTKYLKENKTISLYRTQYKEKKIKAMRFIKHKIFIKTNVISFFKQELLTLVYIQTLNKDFNIKIQEV